MPTGNPHAFEWEYNNGSPVFIDLTNSVGATALSADGYGSLIDAYYADSSGNVSTGAASGSPTTIAGLVTLSPASVPEPTGVCLVAISTLGLLCRRRRIAGL